MSETKEIFVDTSNLKEIEEENEEKIKQELV